MYILFKDNNLHSTVLLTMIDKLKIDNHAMSFSHNNPQKKKKELIEIERKNFKPAFIGYTMTHTYRGKNGFGALTLETSQYYFDKELKQITNRKDLK